MSSKQKLHNCANQAQAINHSTCHPADATWSTSEQHTFFQV
jgi:hypothetical protein